MYQLSKDDYKKIRSYKKFKQDEIALYFYDKFIEDLSDIIFHKIHLKFSSIPFEKGDLVHIIWNSIKKTIQEYKDGENFYAKLQQTCYYQTVNEVKKFITNNELVLNHSLSLGFEIEKYGNLVGENNVSKLEVPEKVLLNELIKNTCLYTRKYTQPTIKKVIYLKSIGYSISKICKITRKSRHHVEELLSCAEDVAKRIFF